MDDEKVSVPSRELGKLKNYLGSVQNLYSVL